MPTSIILELGMHPFTSDFQAFLPFLSGRKCTVAELLLRAAASDMKSTCARINGCYIAMSSDQHGTRW
jgi:hypothetical protein